MTDNQKNLGIGTQHQPIDKRIYNFDEVTIGYTDEQARAEAARCLQCKKPRCKQACPAHVDISHFIAEILNGNLIGAYKIIRTTNSLPAICGRVCPQENQCEGSCILKSKGSPVAIGLLERYVADYALSVDTGLCVGLTQDDTCAMSFHSEDKVVCIGSGPASLTVAGYLVAHGIHVTVLESLHEPGGILVYGIPTFRLPRHVVTAEIESLSKMGVTFVTRQVGKDTLDIQKLFDEGYKAIFIGIGAGIPDHLGISGEDLPGVLLAHDYLTMIHLNPMGTIDSTEQKTSFIGQHITVFGAGNVAMDASRTAIRLGASSVSIIYRRTKAEMPARDEEITYAEEEGVKIMELVSPIVFNSDSTGKLCSVTVQRMELGEPDASGRRSPVPIEGEVFNLETDMAIIAIGSKPNPHLADLIPGLELTKEGYIATNAQGETSIPHVFAGGDIVTGAETVVLAMNAGRIAAQEIAQQLLKANRPNMDDDTFLY